MTFQQFLLILRARRWIIIGALAGVLLLVFAINMLLPKQYTATTALVIDMKMTDPVLGGMGPMMPGYMATQLDIINSERVGLRVIALTKMDQVPVIQELWREETNGEGNFQVWLAALLQKSLDVTLSSARESSIINISYIASDPAFAAAIANAFAQAYIETNLELKVEPARHYAKWFGGQTRGLRDELETAQRKLSAYEQEHGILAGDGRFDIENTRLAELNSQLSMAQGQRADSHSRQSQVNSAESLPEVMANPVVASLKTDLVRREAQRSQLLDRLGKNHPQITQLNEEITELRQRVAEETQRVASSLGTTSRISTMRFDELAVAVEKQQARVLELKKHQDQLAVLRRDVENAQRAYDLVTQRLAQTSLESQAQQTNVAVLTPATPPLNPSSPRVVLNMLIASFLGALLGIGIALLLELFDRRIRSSEDLMMFLDIPVLGVIPMSNSRPGKHVRIRQRPVAA